jgi:hypothetical protein
MKIFGPVYSKYERKGQKAVNFLLKKKNGEVPNAIYHREIGWIDLVWGNEGTGRSDGFGLAKIARFHASVVPVLAERIAEMKVTSRTSNRIKLESKNYLCVVSFLYFESEKTWLLTMFEKASKK